MLSLGLFPLCKKEDSGPGDQSLFRQNILRVFRALGKWLHIERPLGVSNPVVLVGAICSPGVGRVKTFLIVTVGGGWG